ncbi:MAG: hypothetical protein ABWY25_04320 [Paenisporosarcina sp.]
MKKMFILMFASFTTFVGCSNGNDGNSTVDDKIYSDQLAEWNEMNSTWKEVACDMYHKGVYDHKMDEAQKARLQIMKENC